MAKSMVLSKINSENADNCKTRRDFRLIFSHQFG